MPAVAALDQQQLTVSAGAGDDDRVGGCVLAPLAKVAAGLAGAAGGVEWPALVVALVRDEGVRLAGTEVGYVGGGGGGVGDPVFARGALRVAQLRRGDVFRRVGRPGGVPRLYG